MTSPSFYVNEAKKCKCKQILSFLAKLLSVFAAITVASDKLTPLFCATRSLIDNGFHFISLVISFHSHDTNPTPVDFCDHQNSLITGSRFFLFRWLKRKFAKYSNFSLQTKHRGDVGVVRHILFSWGFFLKVLLTYYQCTTKISKPFVKIKNCLKTAIFWSRVQAEPKAVMNLLASHDTSDK